MYETINRVSSEAVKKATGKPWIEWVEFLNNRCTSESTHKDMVKILREEGLVKSGWWQQTIAVGYEIVRGSRVLGETADAGFEVGVQKTVNLSLQETWRLITSETGIKLWLGEVDDMELAMGKILHTIDGASAEIRSIKPEERIRIKWQPRDEIIPSTFQITLTPAKDKTSIRVHHENLSGETSRSEMQVHWRNILDRISNIASESK